MDSDFSEGSFLQTVLPTFGVGNELQMGVSSPKRSQAYGLGRYAFAANAHLTEQHPLNSAASAKQLLSEWGYYWNLSKPVLLEKTPTDMLTARLLQALLSPPPRQQASFLFITRHPLAVSLAHQRWPQCRRMSVASLALHWLVSHRQLAADLPRLNSAATLRYEDLAREPAGCMRTLVAWLRLPAATLPASRVAHDTNGKYERRYCEEHLRSPRQRREHCAMGRALQPGVRELGLGYDLENGGPHGFSCLAEPPPTNVLPEPTPLACHKVPPAAALDRALKEHMAHLDSPEERASSLGERLLCASG